MIRLTISGGDEAVWQQVAARLRGVVIETAGDKLASDRLPQCDAVVLAGPMRACAGDVNHWLRSGKHVLLSVNSCLPNELAELASYQPHRGAGKLAIVNSERYLPSRQAIRQQLDAGDLGEPGLVRIHRWESASTAASAESALPAPVLRDLDLTCWLIGRRPNTVYAVNSNARQGFVQVHLGFSEGAMALIDYASVLPRGDDYRSLSVIGSTGAAYADDHQNVQLVYRGGHPQARRTDEGVGALAMMVQEFVDAIGSQRDLSPSVAAWQDVMRMAHAAERSIQSRRAISLEDC